MPLWLQYLQLWYLFCLQEGFLQPATQDSTVVLPNFEPAPQVDLTYLCQYDSVTLMYQILVCAHANSVEQSTELLNLYQGLSALTGISRHKHKCLT